MRGIGELAVVGEIPDAIVWLFVLLTQLGDVWFLFVGVALFYWLAPETLAAQPRRTGALLVALGVAALAVTVGLKSAFALPRPPGAATASPPAGLPVVLRPLYRDAATGDGFGFPSGHALGTTVVYGGAAVLLDCWTRRRRAAVAAGVIGVVAASRVVLGVHFLADVVAGVAVGLALLAVIVRGAAGHPDRAFALAALPALAALLIATGESAADAVAALGAAAGGFLGWRVGGHSATRLSAGVAVPGLVLTGALWFGALALEPPLVVVALADALAVGLVISLPALVERSKKAW